MVLVEIAGGGLEPLMPIASSCDCACKRCSAEQVTTEVTLGLVLTRTYGGTWDTLSEPRFHN